MKRFVSKRFLHGQKPAASAFFCCYLAKIYIKGAFVRFIAVLQPHLLKLHGVDGSQYSVHVPGVGKSLVRLPEGLLVVLDSNTVSEDPLLFSLLHPLEDLKPVSFHNALVKQQDSDTLKRSIFISIFS